VTEIRLIKASNGWRFATDTDKQMGMAWKVGDLVIFKANKPRNGKHHRLLWALIDLVWANLPEQYAEAFPSKKVLLDEIKFQTGHVETHRTLGGKTVYKPKSIAYDSMDQAAFGVFFDEAMDVVLKYFMPTVSRDEIRDEIEQIAGGSTWR
jgi:hypothetical protein